MELDFREVLKQKSVEKVNAIQSSASEIDVVSERVIENMFIQAYEKKKNIAYIVAGDSTRNNSFNDMIKYYTTQLSKINVSVIDTSNSGQRGVDWVDNTGTYPTTINDAITGALGIDGEDTILEFSFGLNDYDGTSNQQIESNLKRAIDTYIIAKPKSKLILVIPLVTDNSQRIIDLRAIYNNLFTHFSNKSLYPYARTVILDSTIPTSTVHGNPLYYFDGTHPNALGSERVVNWILNEIVPSSLYTVVTLDQKLINAIPIQSNLYSATESGYYGTGDGLPAPSSSWRRMSYINIEPNFNLLITHSGNRHDISFYDASGIYIENKVTSLVSGNQRTVLIPQGAYKAGINISSDSATYDTLNDAPTVFYDVSSIAYMNVEDINKGLKVNNIIKVKETALVDAKGFTGSAGQVPTAQGDGTWLWA